MRRALTVVFLTSLSIAPALGQTPQPFPRPGSSTQPQAPAAVPQAPPPAPRPTAPASQVPPTPAGAAADPSAPSAATLGIPLYPAAQFIASYDAGRGQRYYLYGSAAPYLELVNYYRTQLKDKGDEIYKEPPTLMFEVGKFRQETMAFPPGVTLKDWTWGGSQGYPNPKLGAKPERFPTIIMIVPVPQPVAGGR